MKVDSCLLYTSLKVGDTLSDIREGVHAGVKTVGILEGSSLVGLSEKEMEALSCEERSQVFDKARKAYLEAGADWVVEDIRGIFDLIQ